MSRDMTPWAMDETDALRAWIANPRSMTQGELARRLERTVPSVRNKIAWLRGSIWARKSQRPGYISKASGFTNQASFEVPERIASDDEKHLRLLLAALRQERAA